MNKLAYSGASEGNYCNAIEHAQTQFSLIQSGKTFTESFA